MSILVAGGKGMVGSILDFGLKPSKQELNLTNYKELSDYIKANNITEIIHAAGKVGGVKANSDYMYDFFMENILMNVNVIKACKEHDIKKSTFFLSTCIFPQDAQLPLLEKDIHNGEPHYTNFGYAYAKRMLEVGSRCLKKQYGIESSCLVPCNMYGPNDNYHLENGHVIPSLIHRCYIAKKTNTDFIIWGSGKAEREFLYSGDVAKILKSIHLENYKIPDMMTISPGIVYSIKDVVELIIKHLKFDGKVVFDSNKPEGILKKNTDNTVFKNTFLDFTFTSLDDGLGLTIQDFIKNYNILRK
jgi:GDP-L-fucose synthase